MSEHTLANSTTSMDASASAKAPAPTYWRSLDELEGNAEFQKFLEREFPQNAGAYPEGVTRRRWLQLMGASLALAGVAPMVGCRWPHQKFAPEAVRARTRIPGNAVKFATSFVIGGVGHSLLATSFDGRPIKIDGNPEQADSLGGSTAFLQCSLLGLYDPDRLPRPNVKKDDKFEPSSWNEFAAFAKDHFGKLKGGQSGSLAFLAAAHDGPSMADMRRRVKEAYPQATWCTYEPLAADGERDASRAVYSKPARAVYDLARVDVVVDIDADFLSSHPQSLSLARQFSARRVPENGNMNRLYSIECSVSTTGAAADHRLGVRVSDLVTLLKDLETAIKAKQAGEAAKPPAEGEKVERRQAFLAALADDLVVHRARSVLIAGGRLPVPVHTMVMRLNQLLGNVGQSVKYLAEPADGWNENGAPASLAAAKDLVGKLNNGTIKTLVILGGNPVYDFPADLDLAAALEKVPTRIRLGHMLDETALACNWALPMGHDYESWGDTRSWSGIINIQQPLIAWDNPAIDVDKAAVPDDAPVPHQLDSRSPLEFLSMLVDETPMAGYDIVQRTMRGLLSAPSFDRAWERFVHDGLVDNQATQLADLGSAQTPEPPETPAAVEGLELVLTESHSTYDGRFANNAWLQELPDPMTKMTWGNLAIMAPSTAKELGVWTEDIITLQVGEKSLEVPVYAMPGHAPGSIALALGYGRTAAGHVGGFYYVKYAFDVQKLDFAYTEDILPVGVDAYPLRTTAAPLVLSGVKVTAKGVRRELPITQNHHAIDAVGEEGIAKRLPALVREGTVTRYQEHPDFAQHVVHHPPIVSPWDEPDVAGMEQADPYQYAWGMAIDLSKCTGCNACVAACQVENNVPVVGAEQVTVGREMHWLRIDRYFAGEPEQPTLVTAPILCQHCENAPCEQVCPVAATVHSNEGLNTMAYNRCIGTRYCANNCPYKVRRFNYFDWNRNVHGSIWKRAADSMRMLPMNPEVTVRTRGVMEKCTFCVQRIQEAKIKAKNERRPVRDGEIVPACAEACASEAIVFGNLKTAKGAKPSRVRQLHESPRAYGMLEELNTQPRNRFLARIRNPHPTLDEAYIHLVPESHHGDHHEHEHDHPEGDDHHHAPAHPKEAEASVRPTMLYGIS